MNFSEALNELKRDFEYVRVRRAGWNGKGHPHEHGCPMTGRSCEAR